MSAIAGRKKAMGFERRVFARTDVEVQGHLRWQMKRRIGAMKTHTVPMQTIDLSVHGAKVLADRKVDLPVGASVRIMFHDESSPARVRAIVTNDDDPSAQMLRLQLENPPEDFRRVIEQWLEARKGGREFQESSWLSDGCVEDIYAVDRRSGESAAS